MNWNESLANPIEWMFRMSRAWSVCLAGCGMCVSERGCLARGAVGMNLSEQAVGRVAALQASLHSTQPIEHSIVLHSSLASPTFRYVWSWFFLNDMMMASHISKNALSPLSSPHPPFFYNCSTFQVPYESSQAAQNHRWNCDPGMKPAPRRYFFFERNSSVLGIKKVNVTSQCWLCAIILSSFQLLSQLTGFLEACRNHYASRGDIVMLLCRCEQ